jgi:D-beta-D-heptose 7-phosphate kinase/D-beta-D-heptose 1-phosphate adenosyltransferase
LGEDLVRFLEGFDGKRILVLGDLMLDEFVWGKVARISPEAPVPVVDVQRVTYAPGGAAHVATKVADLGGQVLLFGVVGEDETGELLKRELQQRGIDGGYILSAERRTTRKTRIIAHSQQVVRVDRESRHAISEALALSLLKGVEQNLDSVEAVLISDYAKGVNVPILVQGVISAARKRGKTLLIGPKDSDCGKYKGATIVTLNEGEASEAAGIEITDEASLAQAGKLLLEKAECEAVLITRGEKGMSLFEATGAVTHLPTFAREVYDVTGAGDVVIGTLALALTAGASFSEAANIANYAAGVSVGKIGTAPMTRRELEMAIARG